MQSNSPYQAPQAQLEHNIAAPGSAIIIKQGSATDGARWLFSGFRRVFQSPMAWTGIGLINLLVLLLFTIVSIIPILGSFIPSLFYPVIAAGFMRAAANQAEQRLKVSDLFAGFSEQTGQLFITGALYIAMLLGALIITFIIMMALGFSLFSTGNSAFSDQWFLMLLLAVLLFIGLTLPAIMAIWFTPALIILLKVDAIEAIKLSFKACMRNFVPYLIYGVVALLMMLVVGAIFYGLFAIGLMKDADGITAQGIVLIAAAYLFAVIWGIPIIFCSVYESFIDIFAVDKEAASADQHAASVITRQ